jgi:hypothetical protein
MKRIMIACITVAAFAAPALAGGAPTAGERGWYGQVRSTDASTTYNPTNPTSPVANIGAFFSDRGASNSTDNIQFMNDFSGMSIPATPPAPVCWSNC